MTPLNVAVIGAGNIAKVHVEAIERIPDMRVVTVCNRQAERGRPLAESCGARWLEGYEEAVSQDDVDVVSICTPSGTHAEVALAAARAGKHLIVEKPIDVTLARVDRILEAAREADVKLTCIFPLRFMRGTQEAREAVRGGHLGRITLADAFVKWFRPQSYYAGNWRGTWQLDGGGALMNQSIHSVDLLQWLAGGVKSVFGRTATLAHDMETEDTASAVLEFESGALGVIQGATSAWPGDPARVEVHGENGTVALEEGRIVTWKLAEPGAEAEERMLRLESSEGSGSQDPTAIGWELHRRQIADMAAAIHEDREPAIPGSQARKSVEIVRAIYRSARTGQRVDLPLEVDDD